MLALLLCLPAMLASKLILSDQKGNSCFWRDSDKALSHHSPTLESWMHKKGTMSSHRHLQSLSLLSLFPAHSSSSRYKPSKIVSSKWFFFLKKSHSSLLIFKFCIAFLKMNKLLIFLNGLLYVFRMKKFLVGFNFVKALKSNIQPSQMSQVSYPTWTIYQVLVRKSLDFWHIKNNFSHGPLWFRVCWKACVCVP